MKNILLNVSSVVKRSRARPKARAPQRRRHIERHKGQTSIGATSKASAMNKAIVPERPQRLGGQLFWTGYKTNRTSTRGTRYTALRLRA